MKNIFRVTFICLILTLVIPTINGWKIYSSIISDYYVFLIVVWLCLYFRYLKRKQAFLIIPITLVIMHILAYVLDQIFASFPDNSDGFVNSFILLPGIFMLPASILGSVTAGLLKGTKWLKVFGAVLFITITLIFVCKSEQWFEQWLFYLNYRTTDGIVQEQEPQWQATDSLQHIISNKTFDHKILVLDFWNTGCGICFKKFSILDAVQKAYKDDSLIQFYAINIPMEGDSTGVAFREISKRGYKLNVMVGDTMMPAKFGFSGYPTVCIIRNDRILYRGNIERAIDLLAKIR